MPFRNRVPSIMYGRPRRHKKQNVTDDCHTTAKEHDWPSTNPSGYVGAQKNSDKARHVWRDSEQLCGHVAIAQTFDNRRKE